MKKPITQEDDFGCGVACVAFACGISYQTAIMVLGSDGANTTGYYCKALVHGLEKLGLSYKSRYAKRITRSKIYDEGTIVFVGRSKRYPFGHYLIRHENKWMDPWLNLVKDREISHAKSGYRSRLPGELTFVILRSI